MKNIEYKCAEHDRHSIEQVEQALVGDDPTSPPVLEFDSPVSASDQEEDCIEHERKYHELDVSFQSGTLQGRLLIQTSIATSAPLQCQLARGLVEKVSNEKVGAQNHVDAQGNNLRDDTVEHDVSSRFWIAARLRSLTGPCPSNGLNNKTDSVQGNENNKIPCRRQPAIPIAKTVDDSPENSKVGSTHKRWADDSGRDLHEERGEQRWVFRAP